MTPYNVLWVSNDTQSFTRSVFFFFKLKPRRVNRVHSFYPIFKAAQSIGNVMFVEKKA